MADLTITPANVKIFAATKYQRVKIGEAVAQGQPGYEGADGRYYRADANDTLAKAAASVVFVTPGAAAGDFVIAALEGEVDLGATLAVGRIYVVSATLGGICPAADLATGHWVTTLGIAIAANRLALQPHASGIQYA